MSARLVREPAGEECSRFDRVVIGVGSRRLVYGDQRKLRGLWLADDEAAVREVIGEQRADALGLTGRRLEGRPDGRRRNLKSVLTDRRVVAGLGSVLSDEV